MGNRRNASGTLPRLGIFGSFRRHYAHFFPEMARVVRTIFVRQGANLWTVKERLWCLIRESFLLYDPTETIVVSMPIPGCQFDRAYRCHRFDDTAITGYGHTCCQYFYSCRLFMRLSCPGVNVHIYLAPANVPRGEMAWDVMVGTSGLLLGDRNYWLPSLQAALRKVGVLLAPFGMSVHSLRTIGAQCWVECAIASILFSGN